MSSDTTQDPLTLLRISIQTNTPPILATSDTPPSPSQLPTTLHAANHLIFRSPHSSQSIALPLSTPTRFTKKEGDNPGPVDLRSIYFAWLNKDLAIPEYVALAQGFDARGSVGAGIKNLVFVERLELVGWLEGVQEESEFILPISQIKRDAAAAAGQGGGGMVVGRGRGEGVLQGSQNGAAVVPSTGGPRPPKQIDPRLMEIYSHERVVVNRNTALRGNKPMVCVQHSPLSSLSSSPIPSLLPLNHTKQLYA